ncbi:MAG: type II toxin-antitoxin system prevent-host-death family antitoxin [Gemmatimonadaceae bacterium]
MNRRNESVRTALFERTKFRRLAADGAIVITRHGKPAGVLIGFKDEDDWFVYRLEHHPELMSVSAVTRVTLHGDS